MSLPWFQVERSSRARAGYVAALLGISRHEAQGILWDAWEFAIDWNKDGPPKCELPNRVAARLLAEACGFPVERADELIDAFRQAGFVEVTRSITRVKGLERYASAWRRHHNLNADGSKRSSENRAATARKLRGNCAQDEDETKTETYGSSSSARETEKAQGEELPKPTAPPADGQEVRESPTNPGSVGRPQEPAQASQRPTPTQARPEPPTPSQGELRPLLTPVLTAVDTCRLEMARRREAKSLGYEGEKRYWTDGFTKALAEYGQARMLAAYDSYLATETVTTRKEGEVSLALRRPQWPLEIFLAVGLDSWLCGPDVVPAGEPRACSECFDTPDDLCRVNEALLCYPCASKRPEIAESGRRSLWGRAVGVS